MKKFTALILFCVSPLFAQNTISAIDTFLVEQDTSKIVKTGQMNEFFLETIRIEAIIEKPNVALIPKKLEADVGQLPFSRRSFDEELKATPEEFIDYGEDIESGKKITTLKKSLAKDN
jgi:hypothetical protein